MQNNIHINYVEFKANDLEKVKNFYSQVFGWGFTDYGPTYTAFSKDSSGLDGGFELSDKPIVNGALVVFYHIELEEIQEKIKAHGGAISVPTFSFPGGRRFHFIDPVGNELAIWTDK